MAAVFVEDSIETDKILPAYHFIDSIRDLGTGKGEKE